MRPQEHLHRSWNGATRYLIRVRGTLRATWSDRLGGMRIEPDECDPRCTILEGPLPDQAALMGVLKGLYDLGMPLLNVQCIETFDEGRGDQIG